MQNNLEEVLKLLLTAMNQNKEREKKVKDSFEIPVGISNRHIHLAQREVDALFGKGYSLTKLKDLSQPGEFACKETITICGPKGAIEKVRVLGPIRSKTQVEISLGDSIKTGVAPSVRLSGDLKNTSGIALVGTMGSALIQEGVIVAQRHIHMTNSDAQHFNVSDGEVVSIEVDGIRGGILKNVNIRTNDNFKLECHLDVEEANSLGITSKSKIKIVK
ncbi:MAG: phosphate propanoyltransferase [Clostridium sp.]|uniref:phosphate propanoyltransferase n=1 Tax=Clostridium sp. TaxID=1506 RepID=UPI003F34951B